jgi:CrcB protein
VTALWVALAGGFGTLARYLVGAGAERFLGWRFPAGTLMVNLLGSMAIGFAFSIFAARGELDTRARIVVTTGFLGGFTTYSAFAYESLQLLERRQPALFAVYLLATVIGAMAGCYLGMRIGRAVAS